MNMQLPRYEPGLSSIVRNSPEIKASLVLYTIIYHSSLTEVSVSVSLSAILISLLSKIPLVHSQEPFVEHVLDVFSAVPF